MLKRVKLGLLKIDKLFFKGKIKAYYSRNFKYKGKAYKLTKDLYFPPHTSANKNVRMGAVGELLAIGGDLSTDRMIHALKNGIYPMFFNNEPILWWTSEIRCVLFPKDIHISKNIRSLIRKNNFFITVDKTFDDVVRACSESRQDYTWLNPERMALSFKLHKLGVAHSIEVWQDEKLVGGLFGIALGSCWFGDSMFARVSNTSKLAMVALTLRLEEMNFFVEDCGFWPTDHLKSMGAVIIPREEFLEILERSIQTPDIIDNWSNLFVNWDLRLAAEKHIANEHQS